jgi:hypothetical protein
MRGVPYFVFPKDSILVRSLRKKTQDRGPIASPAGFVRRKWLNVLLFHPSLGKELPPNVKVNA